MTPHVSKAETTHARHIGRATNKKRSCLRSIVIQSGTPLECFQMHISLRGYIDALCLAVVASACFGVVSECVRSVFGIPSEGEGNEGLEWEGRWIKQNGLKDWSDGGAGKTDGRRRGMEDGDM